MTRHFMTILSASALALSVAAAPAFAEYKDWDKNQDQAIDTNEFEAQFGETGLFNEWDTDDSDSLNQTEFDNAVGDWFGEDSFARWDADSNDSLSSEEFHEAMFSDYDLDQNQQIDQSEYSEMENDMNQTGS